MQLKNQFLTVAASAVGVSLLVQVLAFWRQILIASYFGVGRDFDSYVTIYALATLLIFIFGNIFDLVAVPHLVRTRENEGHDAALALSRSIFYLSLVLSAGMSVVFLIAVPLVAPIFATGFSLEERSSLAKLVWYFLPWTLVCVPYYAAGAQHKMEWHYNRVFFAEIVIIAVSTGFLALRHDDIRMLPLAYASGYAVGLVLLAGGAWHGVRKVPSSSVRDVMRNVGELFLSYQSGGLRTLVDRHIQSFLIVGGIGAVNYSTQIIASLSNLLTLREIYMVPLARQTERIERLERLLSGLVLLAVPLSVLVACFAPELIKVMLQRGRFDTAATVMTADVLRIAAFSLILGAVSTPLFRMLQIVDRIHSTHLVNLITAVSVAIFGYLFVFGLDWGVRGIALMQLSGGTVGTISTAYLVGRYGVPLRWRTILGWLMLAVFVSGIACVAAVAAIWRFENAWLRLAIGGAVFGSVVLLCYFVVREQLRLIVFGLTPSRGDLL